MLDLLKKAISSKAGDSFTAIRFSKTAVRALNGAVGDPLGFEAKGKQVPRPANASSATTTRNER